MARLAVEICVPTRGLVQAETAQRITDCVWELWDAGHDCRVTYHADRTSGVSARNALAAMFLAGEGDVLMMVDDDVVLNPNGLRIVEHVAEGTFGIVAAPAPIIRPGTVVLPNVFTWKQETKEMEPDFATAAKPGLQEVDLVGFGAVAISRAVMSKLKVFKERYEKGQRVLGVDLDFCLRARSQGFKVGVDMDLMCEHLVSVHLNAVGYHYAQLLGVLKEEESDGGL